MPTLYDYIPLGDRVAVTDDQAAKIRDCIEAQQARIQRELHEVVFAPDTSQERLSEEEKARQDRIKSLLVDRLTTAYVETKRQLDAKRAEEMFGGGNATKPLF